MQNILTNVCNLCCCKPHHTHWPDDIRHTRSCWNRNECHEIIPSMHVNQKLHNRRKCHRNSKYFPPPCLILSLRNIFCVITLCIQVYSADVNPAAHTQRQHEALILREGGWWRSQRPHCARWASMLLTVQSWGSEKAARRTCKQTQRGAHIQSAD